MKDTIENSRMLKREHDLILFALFHEVDKIDPRLRVAFGSRSLFFVFIYVRNHSRNLLS